MVKLQQKHLLNEILYLKLIFQPTERDLYNVKSAWVSSWVKWVLAARLLAMLLSCSLTRTPTCPDIPATLGICLWICNAVRWMKKTLFFDPSFYLEFYQKNEEAC